MLDKKGMERNTIIMLIIGIALTVLIISWIAFDLSPKMIGGANYINTKLGSI